MSNSPLTVNSNASYCPLCQQSNACQVDAPQGCWCASQKVPNALIKKVPAAQQGKACICQACINKFNLTESDNFKSL